jgi:hypothetical protein
VHFEDLEKIHTAQILAEFSQDSKFLYVLSVDGYFNIFDLENYRYIKFTFKYIVAQLLFISLNLSKKNINYHQKFYHNHLHQNMNLI